MPSFPLSPSPSPARSLRVPMLHAGLAGILAAGVAVCMPNQYRSEARILSDAGHAGGGSALRTGVWAPTAPPEIQASREDGPTVIYVDILKSRRMVEQLLQRDYDYTERPWRFARPRRVQGTLQAYLGAANLDRAVGPLRRVLGVQRDAKSGLLTITAETRAPELSRQVVRQAAENLRDFLVEFSQPPARTRPASPWAGWRRPRPPTRNWPASSRRSRTPTATGTPARPPACASRAPG